MDKRHLIEPENLGLWVTVTFIIALLSLVIGLTNLYRTAAATALTQIQILELNHKVDALSPKAKP
jgi:hypothetical protein